MSLRTRLLLWYTGVFALSGFLLTGALYALIAHKLRSETDKFLEDEYEECLRITAQHLGNPEMLRATIRREIGEERYFPLTYRLRDTRAGRDLFCLISRKYRQALAEAAPLPGRLRDRYYTTVWVGDRPRPFRLLAGPLDRERHPGLVIQVGMYTRRLAKRVASLRKYLAVILASTLLLATLGGWLLASRSLKPIDQLAADLSRVESSTLGERLAVGPSGSEIDRLRRAVNRMLERLDAAFERLKSFTADAAHELRTPISALQCRLEVAVDQIASVEESRNALSDALEQAAELGALVENLLLLARMDGERALPAPQRVDLGPLLEDLAEPFALLAEQKDVTLAVAWEGAVETSGDRELLRRLFGNLLDNAVRYTPAGGRVEVRATAEADGCRVTVADTGVGIEPEALERIFERFYRADESRSRAAGGAGLGLSIVQRVVELHRGTIDVESTPGQGTTVTVWLPPCPPEAVGSSPAAS
jgi:heavy metal sensor kinase